MSESFKWSSEGHLLCRKIAANSCLQYEPHDYQIESVCKSLDGINLLAITPTGSCKTSYYILYMFFMRAIQNDPTLCPTAKFSKNLCLSANIIYTARYTYIVS